MSSKIPTFVDIGQPVMFKDNEEWVPAVIRHAIDNGSMKVDLTVMRPDELPDYGHEGVPHMTKIGKGIVGWLWPEEALAIQTMLNGSGQ